MLSQARGEGDGGYMSKSSVRTVFSEISFSVHWPYDGTSKIWNHRQTTLCSCCRRNSNEYLQTKTRIWTKSHDGSCLTSVNKSLSEMVTLSFAVFFFFAPSPAHGLKLGVLILHSRPPPPGVESAYERGGDARGKFWIPGVVGGGGSEKKSV